jgi:hypothetical protein
MGREQRKGVEVCLVVVVVVVEGALQGAQRHRRGTMTEMEWERETDT